MSDGSTQQQIAILGSTGSIGTSCLKVLRAHPQRFSAHVITANRRWQDLAAQCHEFRPAKAILTGIGPDEIDRSQFPSSVELLFGEEPCIEAVQDPVVDTVVTGIVGAAGLRTTWAALEAGKRVAFANKETLVVGGSLIVELLRHSGAELLPVDSEHSAVFQTLQCGRREDLQRIILTASGGPFRKATRQELEEVTVAQALAHPTWNMGAKITIDSATMMNKALEVIEARWLFDVTAAEIDVVVHPESIVHSMVEFNDGSVVAHLSPPDMCLPIQYALTWPERVAGVSPRMDFTQAFHLHFEPPDPVRFPALELGFEVARQGGTAGAVLNAANEVAVDRFLNEEIRFTDIPRLCRSILESHSFDAAPTLDDVLRLDEWSRLEATRWTSS
ncbi:MAG: 1-deoxy-D-xylulose-5-phosphate reductoisomerase [Planctomycetaceae bacterium]|nr:1-deoxy-D-xylulose-5-phosphate reductoisomerase [Planctomycetaceae bacterium]